MVIANENSIHELITLPGYTFSVYTECIHSTYIFSVYIVHILQYIGSIYTSAYISFYTLCMYQSIFLMRVSIYFMYAFSAYMSAYTLSVYITYTSVYACNIYIP